jgi:hypothetical protein
MNTTRRLFFSAEFRTKRLLSVAAFPLLFLLTGPLQAFVNEQNASNVLGQASFTAAPSGTRSQHSVSGGYQAYDAGSQRLFVSDTNNSRVLIYDLSGGLTNNMDAAIVLGQADFTSRNAVLTQNRMANPAALAYDAVGKRLFVGDMTYARILVYDLSISSAIINGMNASYVLGAPDFVTKQPNIGNPYLFPFNDQTIFEPLGMAWDPTTNFLFVSDTVRVLVFDMSSGISNYMHASYVLGQPDFAWHGPTTTDGYNLGLHQPIGLTVDVSGRRLFVVDNTGNRVFVYDLSKPMQTEPAASYVLGQYNFYDNAMFPNAGSGDTVATQNGFAGPVNVTYDPTTQELFVLDSGNPPTNYIYNRPRVLMFDLSGGIVNGMNATQVLGEPDFTTLSLFPGTITANQLTASCGMTYDSVGHRLFIGDINRILVFNQTDLNNTAGTTPVCTNPTMICGTVTAAENSSVTLSGVPIQLRNSQGQFVATTQSDSSGKYSFDSSASGGNLVTGVDYYVVPVTGRTESATPMQFPIPTLTAVGAIANLQIRGVPGMLKIASSSPGSAILISTSRYNGSVSPTLDPNNMSGFYTATAGWDGSASVSVPTGGYYITCWASAATGGSVVYNRVPSNGSNGPYNITPNLMIPITCGG